MVFFDKKNAQETPIALTERAQERRKNQHIGWDAADQPVKEEYLHALEDVGTIVSVSRWLNGAVLETNLTEHEVVTRFPFVTEIRGTSPAPKPADAAPEAKSLEYGVAFEQVNQINADCLHAQDYTGSGIFLAIIDAGFARMDSVVYLSNVFSENRILDTKNFVHPGNNVYNSSGHGTMVASCMVGEKTGLDPFAGTGVDVDLALYLTEDVTSETEIEEFYLVAALERCDSMGVDVVNISLGYFGFDDSTTSHAYADLDGETTVAAIGINVAASKGIAVVTSAGNSGPSNISTPCDAPGALCVGAVDEFGVIAPFSSLGPSADGRTKPDVAARGFGTWVSEFNTGTLQQGNGTSFSSPTMCGGVACLRQAHPTASVEELFDAIRESATQATNPDNFLGFGIPDLCYAHIILNQEELEKEVVIYPNPADDEVVISSNSLSKEMQLFDALGNCVWKDDDASLYTYIPASELASGTYLLVVSGAQDFQGKVVILHP